MLDLISMIITSRPISLVQYYHVIVYTMAMHMDRMIKNKSILYILSYNILNNFKTLSDDKTNRYFYYNT